MLATPNFSARIVLRPLHFAQHRLRCRTVAHAAAFLRPPASTVGKLVNAADDAFLDALGGHRRHLVVFVADRDVVDRVLHSLVHPLHAVEDDHGRFVDERRIVAPHVRIRRSRTDGCCRLDAAALAGERGAAGRAAEHKARARAIQAAQIRSPIRWKPNIE